MGALLIVVSLLCISAQLAIIAYDLCNGCSCCKKRKAATGGKKKTKQVMTGPRVEPARPAKTYTPEERKLHRKITSWAVDDEGAGKKAKK